MPKSKVRKKPVKQRGRAAGSETEAMTIPLWEYPTAIKAMSDSSGDSEQNCFRILMALPIRFWSLDTTKITSSIPMEQAEKGGMSIDEWYESHQVLHEIGAIAWDDNILAHYFTMPQDTITSAVAQATSNL